MSPADREPVPQRVDAEETAPRFLLVEDDPDVAKLVRMVAHGLVPEAEIDHVCDVESAVELLGKHRFELVLADYLLEGGAPGTQLKDAVRATQPRARFAMMSSLPLDEHMRIQGDHSFPVLRKPFTLQACRDFLGGVLEARPRG